ncbi:MAG: ATP-binding protein [Granulosicoccus sp.]
MSIRNKLLLATTIPIVLFVVQVLTVNYFIRELQLAVQFIGAAQNVIEADLKSIDLVKRLQTKIKNVPQTYVQPNDSVSSIKPLWQEISANIDLINASSATQSVNADTIASFGLAYDNANDEIENLSTVLTDTYADFNTLLLLAISSNDALVKLDEKLSALAVELRQQLQLAVDREKVIHNRPIIAGVVLGSLAVALLMLLVWIYVDRGIVRKLTILSQSMLAIAGGDLRAPLPKHQSKDEIGKMGRALAVFRENAIEIQESNLREIAQARKQRQFWLEHMASFLRHELKNKQVGAEQSIRLLASKEGQNQQVMKYCERASASLMDMKELINSTVDAADIESALLSENYTALDVRELLQRYTTEINEQFSARLKFINDTSEHSIINGDRQRLEQMLDKLITNAMDFKFPETEVIIRLAQLGERQITISVENHGPALPADTQALFGLSVSIRSREKKQQGNVGFGLFVARRIAEYHNGTIAAKNSAKGPIFTICLPTSDAE